MLDGMIDLGGNGKYFRKIGLYFRLLEVLPKSRSDGRLMLLDPSSDGF
jgi:hypothetical protein